MYKNPAATRVTAENCPPRIILDETSTSIAEVMEKVSNGFFTQAIIAYIWRQSQEKRDRIKESVIHGVFEPLAACLPFWERCRLNQNNPEFILSDVFDLASGRGIPGARDVTCQYRVGSFGSYNPRLSRKLLDVETQLLEVFERGVELGRFKGRDLQKSFCTNATPPVGRLGFFYEDFKDGPQPHIDGDMENIYENKSSEKKDIRALTVYQGEGTFFWGETPADLGEEWPFSSTVYIDRSYLQEKKIFQASAGDVIFFKNGQRLWRDSFIHQAAMANLLNVDDFALNEARLLSTYNMTLTI